MTDNPMISWLDDHEGVASVTTLLVDMNGIPRGKHFPRDKAAKIGGDGLKMPMSGLGVDVRGDDVMDNGLVFETGDQDGFLRLTGRGPFETTWGHGKGSIAPVWMFNEEGSPSEIDPRHALQRVLDRFADKGLSPVCATELEFAIYDLESRGGEPVRNPVTGVADEGGDVYSVEVLADYEPFINDIYTACKAMDIPADCAISEAGCGQFEINLYHTDAMKAADDAVLFRHVVRSVARSHGFGATFMAKPWGEQPGNGLHVHFSVLDSDGSNIFDNGGEEGTDTLRHAIAGLMDNMADHTLIFAPHFNSYQRLTPGAHAPTKICWGYENRTVALRVPNGPAVARRIEHRVAGADANPYLVLAAILGSALLGIEAGKEPAAPVSGNAYACDETADLPETWLQAIRAFDASETRNALFGEQLGFVYLAIKRQEYDSFRTHVDQHIRDTYIRRV